MKVPDGLKRNAVICVVRHRGEYLLLLRDREPNCGLYVPVGGKLDPYESARDAAIREIREEAGIVVDDVKLAGSLVETSPTSYNWWSNVYVADLPAETPRPELVGCKEGTLGWFAREALGALAMPPTDLAIYDLLDRETPFALAAEYDGDLRLVTMVDEFSGAVLA